jgi:hypothetical protein
MVILTKNWKFVKESIKIMKSLLIKVEKIENCSIICDNLSQAKFKINWKKVYINLISSGEMT